VEVLQIYEVGSSQQLNKAKTTVFFSKSTNEESRQMIKDCLGVEEIRSYEKYLGLPSLVGRNKKAVSTTSRSMCRGSFKVGKKNYFLKAVEKS